MPFLTDTTQNAGGGFTSLIPTLLMLGLVVVFFYFFMIRPQKKQEKEALEMRNSLQIGDEVTTIGGIVGIIVAVNEETVLIETGKEHSQIRFLKGAIKTVDLRASEKYTENQD